MHENKWRKGGPGRRNSKSKCPEVDDSFPQPDSPLWFALALYSSINYPVSFNSLYLILNFGMPPLLAQDLWLSTQQERGSISHATPTHHSKGSHRKTCNAQNRHYRKQRGTVTNTTRQQLGTQSSMKEKWKKIRNKRSYILKQEGVNLRAFVCKAMTNHSKPSHNHNREKN